MLGDSWYNSFIRNGLTDLDGNKYTAENIPTRRGLYIDATTGQVLRGAQLQAAEAEAERIKNAWQNRMLRTTPQNVPERPVLISAQGVIDEPTITHDINSLVQKTGGTKTIWGTESTQVADVKRHEHEDLLDWLDRRRLEREIFATYGTPGAEFGQVVNLGGKVADTALRPFSLSNNVGLVTDLFDDKYDFLDAMNRYWNTSNSGFFSDKFYAENPDLARGLNFAGDLLIPVGAAKATPLIRNRAIGEAFSQAGRKVLNVADTGLQKVSGRYRNFVENDGWSFFQNYKQAKSVPRVSGNEVVQAFDDAVSKSHNALSGPGDVILDGAELWAEDGNRFWAPSRMNADGTFVEDLNVLYRPDAESAYFETHLSSGTNGGEPTSWGKKALYRVTQENMPKGTYYGSSTTSMSPERNLV